MRDEDLAVARWGTRTELRKMKDAWLLFLHGINARVENRWIEPLNGAISRAGHEPFPSDRVIAPDYRAALRGELPASSASRNTWKSLGKESVRAAETQYLSKMALLETRLRPLSGNAPARVRQPQYKEVPPLDAVLGDAKRYAGMASVRNSVHEIILKSLEDIPHGAEVIIVAHSLGSVVAANIVKKLPAHLHVSALITIGSPLGSIGDFRNGDLHEYPYDRIAAWVNVFDPRDVVTGGRGIAEFFPKVVDVPVALQDWLFPALVHQHGAEYYCSNNVVATAITLSLLGAEVNLNGSEARTNVRGFELPLLQSLYLRELAKRLPSDAGRSARLERARNVTATEHAAASAFLHERDASVSSLPPSEFLQRPHAHIRGVWDDNTVLALAIMLAASPPAPPFAIEATPGTDERRRALLATLDLIRIESSELTDVDIEEAVFVEHKAVNDYFTQGKSWIPVIAVGAGVITLAATGIGIAAAVPAGLAGAALITSTLAAFGPGGMIGGLATLTALAGVGSAMAAGGGAALGAGVTRQKVDLLSRALDEAVASGDPSQVRGLVVSLLTLTAVQERLDFPSQREPILHTCLNTKASLAFRAAAHDEVDPKSQAAKSVKEMMALMEKAIAWLYGVGKNKSDQAARWDRLTSAYSDALEGRTDKLQEELSSGQGEKQLDYVRPDLPMSQPELGM